MKASASGARNLYERVDWFKRDLDDIRQRLVIAGYVKKVTGLIADARHAGNDDE
jgi:hypothetical protein